MSEISNLIEKIKTTQMNEEKKMMTAIRKVIDGSKFVYLRNKVSDFLNPSNKAISRNKTIGDYLRYWFDTDDCISLDESMQLGYCPDDFDYLSVENFITKKEFSKFCTETYPRLRQEYEMEEAEQILALEDGKLIEKAEKLKAKIAELENKYAMVQRSIELLNNKKKNKAKK